VDDQGRDVELLEVFREIRLGEGLDAVEGAFEPDLHRPQPEHVQNALRHLGTRSVGTEEGHAEILVELRAVRADAGTDLVEHPNWQAAWIGFRLEHQWGYRAHQYGLGDARGSVAADVAAQKPGSAVRLWGAAEALHAAIGAPIPPIERANYEQAVAAARTELGESVFAATWTEGRTTPLEQVISTVLKMGDEAGKQ